MIKDNLQSVSKRIADACLRSKRDAQKIVLVCVTKGQTITKIQEVVDLGLKYFAENKVQEALLKYQKFPQSIWQMVGHLQTNKVKAAVEIFDLIHSVDSLELAKEINKQAAKINKIQNVLLEVKTSWEATKFGFNVQDLIKALLEIKALSNLCVQGLMTIAPAVSRAEDSRFYFKQLRLLRDEINPAWLLSMGMSDDFEVAIEEGADMIRLGRVIFDD